MQAENRVNGRDEADVWKGLVAGLIGGLVASWTMNRFQDVWIALADTLSPDGGEGTGKNQREQAKGSGEEEQDDTTVRAASAVSEGIFDHKLTESEKKWAGPAVHYSFGTAVG